MSRSGEITLAFGDGEYAFRLAIGQWRKVQEACDAGPAELLARLAPPFNAMAAGVAPKDVIASGLLGRWRIDDVRAPIFQGLLGGGTEPVQATRLLVAYVDERPLLEAVPVAYKVVLASLVGAEDEAPSGEPMGETAPPLSPAASSASASTASTPRAARSASRRAKSTT